MRIFFFGNPFIKKDATTIKLINRIKKVLPGFLYIHADPNENFPPANEKKLLIVDTVIGIENPLLLDIDDLKQIEKSPISPHDYDLLFHLLLLRKIGRLEKVRIIGIPVGWTNIQPIVKMLKRLQKE